MGIKLLKDVAYFLLISINTGTNPVEISTSNGGG
jgi:hypothetical protein